ncbi:MAG: hypothetical protein KGD57_07620 [Candidatus Lokiarchaeota archaeon]|nr:hypothetical protein [Candidatus Lokiarchaeota archaeon]
MHNSTCVRSNDEFLKLIKELDFKIGKICDTHKAKTTLEAITQGYKIGNII